MITQLSITDWTAITNIIVIVILGVITLAMLRRQ